MSNQLDLSGFETLKIYEVAKNMSAETNKPLVEWLHLMAADVEIVGRRPKLPPDSANIPQPGRYKGPPLILRPNNNWEKTIDRRLIIPRKDRKHYSPWLSRVFPVTVCVPWKLKFSILFHFRQPLDSATEPPDLEKTLHEEGVLVHKDDFRAWCEPRYPLPKFWFGGAEQDGLSKPCEVMRSRQVRFCSTKDKKEAKATIIPRIREKISNGQKWHHKTEVRKYMQENNISSEKEGGLTTAVKAELKSEGISCPLGKPPRN